jgi:hypothetical protein
MALGLLEAALGPGEAARAEESFAEAETLAVKAGYIDVLWQIRFHFGKLLHEGNRTGGAARLLREAFGGLKASLAEVPGHSRESYLAAAGGLELMQMLERLLRQGSGDRETPLVVL